ncbi:hypothetical protein [Mesorhizobium koreense]|uniref:hypothetical protein n=1 Tax=Mesorhizobium koreense TaxID=3074855 RepID=UPI00287B715B|nr:hypothetical protein [Mesorhizobium sp. WR6]
MTKSAGRASFPRMIDQFLRQRVAETLPPRELERLRIYLHSLIADRQSPPKCGSRPDWSEIGQECRIPVETLERVDGVLSPAIDAITRFVGPQTAKRKQSRWRGNERNHKTKLNPGRHRSVSGQSRLSATPEILSAHAAKPTDTAADPASAVPRRKRGMTPKPIIEFPEPLWTIWEEPESFTDALKLHMERHGDTCWHLYRAVARSDENFDRRTLLTWLQGTKGPRSVSSFEILGRIESRYRLPEGYFKAKLAHPARATTGHQPTDITPSQRRRFAWHLPDDFDRRPPKEREEILEWVQRIIISGGTDYRRFQALALRNRYAVRFPGILDGSSFQEITRFHEVIDVYEDDFVGATNTAIDAPERLWKEMAQLLDFKTATLTTFGYQRVGVWGEETAAQKVEHFGLLFGALAAPPKSAIGGLGIPVTSLTFAMLVFPSVWDWYLLWRERRRGFYTAWEVDMLRIALALTRVETGWLRQHPELAEHLAPVPGLVSEDQIAAARTNWNEACDICHKHCTGRVKEIQRVVKVHRDPFEPIMPILEAESPVGEYRKIADEIIRTMPDERRYSSAAAEAVRSFLLIRFGLHTGLRQKNLRQLLICPRGKLPTSERQLADMKVGELRWSERDHGWEVFIPSVAFKNANSSYFGDKPFRLVLPNVGDLYRYIDAYVEHHRARLLKGTPDPGTFFVKTVKVTSTSAAYCQNTFFEAWRLIIQRYGIYNPYTGRGVIEGLLPHGPHNIRDVLATHILKKTGSYEQASYAIQDTPEMVAKHYGRFLPQDKAALAARILNQVWEAA